MFRIKLTVLFIAGFVTAYAQKLDTTVFNSVFERKAFNSYADSSNPDPLKFFCAVSYKKGAYDNIRKSIDTIMNDLLDEGIAKKPLKKKVKMIYKRVHEDMLKKYENNVIFNEILYSGEYNCVSATALYSEILDKTGIKYKILEQPDHVYIIVDPDNTSILMESTNPQKGVIIYDERFKKDYVKYLYSNKLIAKDEYINKSMDELFNEYMYSDAEIDKYELAGLHYYNRGSFFMEKEEFNDAAACYEKAYFLYPGSKTIAFLYYMALSNVLNNEAAGNDFHGKTLAKYVNINIHDDVVMQSSVDFFKSVLNTLIVERSAPEKGQRYYSEFISFISDSVNTQEFTFNYYFINGYYYLIKGEYEKSLNYADTAYHIHPDNMHIKGIIHDDFSKIIFSMSQTNSNVYIDTLFYYFDKFPFLFDYNYLEQFFYSVCFFKTKEYFDQKNEKEGTLLLQKIDSMLTGNQNLASSYKGMSGMLYSIDQYYRYDKPNADTLISVFSRYHKYFPDDYTIKAKLEDIKERKSKNKSLKYENVYDPRDVFLQLMNLTQDEQVQKKTIPEDYKGKFKKIFTGCWNSSKYKLSDSNTLKDGKPRNITVSKGYQLKYTVDGKTIKGKWSIRPKEKLLYFTYGDNSDYLVFSIVKIEKEQIELRPYKNDKLSNKIIIFKPCKQ